MSTSWKPTNALQRDGSSYTSFSVSVWIATKWHPNQCYVVRPCSFGTNHSTVQEASDQSEKRKKGNNACCQLPKCWRHTDVRGRKKKHFPFCFFWYKEIPQAAEVYAYFKAASLKWLTSTWLCMMSLQHMFIETIIQLVDVDFCRFNRNRIYRPSQHTSLSSSVCGFRYCQEFEKQKQLANRLNNSLKHRRPMLLLLLFLNVG